MFWFFWITIKWQRWDKTSLTNTFANLEPVCKLRLYSDCCLLVLIQSLESIDCWTIKSYSLEYIPEFAVLKCRMLSCNPQMPYKGIDALLLFSIIILRLNLWSLVQLLLWSPSAHLQSALLLFFSIRFNSILRRILLAWMINTIVRISMFP